MSKYYWALGISFTVIVSSVCSQTLSADISGIKKKHIAVAYGSVSGAQKLDIYLPDSVQGKLPVIVSVHGGAVMFGDKGDGQLTPMLEGIKRGYAVISINYRLSGEAKFPAQIHDVKAAIRWIRANAKTYGLELEKIAIWGGSAGGYLAALAGTSGRVKELEDLTLGNETYSSKVQAVVDWFGPMDFLQMDPQFKASGKGKPDHSEANSPESKLMGRQITEIPDLVAKANPESYITKDDPPFFIEHGTNDNLVPAQQSEGLYNKLKAVLGEDMITLTLLEGAGHGGAQFEAKTNLDKIFLFLDKTVKKNKN